MSGRLFSSFLALTVLALSAATAFGDGSADACRHERTAAIPIGNTWTSDTLYRADRSGYDLFVKDTVRVHEARHRNLGFEDPLDTAFHLKGLRNVTLDFGGATLTLHGKIQPFVIDGCTNVTIRNVRVRYARCGYSQAEVVSIAGNTMTVRFDRGKFPYKVVDGALVFTCPDWPDRHVDKAPCFTQFYDGGTRRGKAIALGFFDRNPYIDPKLPWAPGVHPLHAPVLSVRRRAVLPRRHPAGGLHLRPAGHRRRQGDAQLHGAELPPQRGQDAVAAPHELRRGGRARLRGRPADRGDEEAELQLTTGGAGEIPARKMADENERDVCHVHA